MKLPVAANLDSHVISLISSNPAALKSAQDETEEEKKEKDNVQPEDKAWDAVAEVLKRFTLSRCAS